jgi:mannosyltransferase OCH1-like enzyme
LEFLILVRISGERQDDKKYKNKRKLIPRAIHQIWMQGKLSIPSKYKNSKQSWHVLHPAYTITVWDEHDLEKLVHGSYWEELIAKCTTLIQRADIYRCAILERVGGVYVDMDMYALKSLEPLLVELDTSTFDIAVGQTSFWGTPLHSLLGLNNAWISARPNSEFWKKVYYPQILLSLHQYTLLDMISPLYGVLKTSGPGAWTSFSSKVKVLPQEYFYSLKKVKKSLLTPEDIDLLKPLSYAYHMQEGDWITSWETLLIQVFIGNNWKYTLFVLLLIVLYRYLA